MYGLFYLFLVGFLIALIGGIFLYTPAERLARLAKYSGPIAAITAGIILTLAGRGIIGLPMAGLGLAWWQSSRMLNARAIAKGLSRPTIRAAALEIEIDPVKNIISGKVLSGMHEGRALANLSVKELVEALYETRQDAESAALFEAYLDRRMPAWREDTQLDIASWEGGASGSGTMSEQEAYQVLGLSPGASPQQVADAHRLLVKAVNSGSRISPYILAQLDLARDRLAG